MRSRVVPFVALPLLAGLALCSCSSVEVMRLQTGPPTVAGVEPGEIVVAVQARCLGFYVGTIGIPSCDLDDVLNGLLRETSAKLRAKRLHEVRFEATPDSGVWWLTKLLWFRGARVSALAVVPTEVPHSQGAVPHSRRAAPHSQPSP